ncbi:TIGR01244 family sulfur transferase [Paracoccus aerodenitrificans]|uniref:TIGR01244 family sulfur transferase n=1 Tax=Paracoccus aerodenitrificans TaxID=3017781 RepID=UPI0022F07EC4|nr:TIGR01244 family sulfur transferase [Paracoccus aerodenitrificans]WBU65384.1 TIGR01244 family sulfur transferase [Paracoccus aerodenitrificans]
MDIRKIDDRISVSPQIQEDELAGLAEMGFRSVICNRPDGESPDQPDQARVEAAAKAAGLGFQAIPITPGQLDADTVAEFGQALEALPGPVLAYCRSGTRSATVWALSQSGLRSRDDILRAAREAGYDLGGIAGALRDPA